MDANRSMRRGAFLTVLTLVIFWPLLSANAATGLWFDPRGDMMRTSDVVASPAPNHTIGDIRRVRVSNGDRYVRIRVMFTDLARRGRCLDMSSKIATRRLPANDPAWFYINAGPGCEDPGTGTWAPRAETWTAGEGLRFIWAWKRNFILVRLPRASLQNPGWVRVQVRFSHVNDAGRGFGDGLDRDWTPRVYRR